MDESIIKKIFKIISGKGKNGEKVTYIQKCFRCGASVSVGFKLKKGESFMCDDCIKGDLKNLAAVRKVKEGASYWEVMPKNILYAHEYCSNNKEQLEKSTKCGCFYCLKIFSSKEISQD